MVRAVPCACFGGLLHRPAVAGDQRLTGERVGRERREEEGGRSDVGAMVTFTGVCRGDENGDSIAALTLEYYPGMAESEIERHVSQAAERWPLSGVIVIHRYGRVLPGENIVLVATASSHREAAFSAAEFIMDYLKTRAPFWKKELTPAGERWVEARASDDEAARRW